MFFPMFFCFFFSIVVRWYLFSSFCLFCFIVLWFSIFFPMVFLSFSTALSYGVLVVYEAFQIWERR